MQRLRVQSPKLIIHGDEKNKGTPRTNTSKVVCTKCGTNINSENKIIHSKRVHPGKIVKFQPHLESCQYFSQQFRKKNYNAILCNQKIKIRIIFF